MFKSLGERKWELYHGYLAWCGSRGSLEEKILDELGRALHELLSRRNMRS